MGSQAGACGARRGWAGGGELAPPWAERQPQIPERPPAFLELTSQLVVWLLQIEGQWRCGCLEKSGQGDLGIMLSSSKERFEGNE